MKVCYVNPTNNIRRPIAELAEILAEEGHQISIMFPVSKECPTKNWVANDRIKNGKIKLIPIKSWYFAPLRYNFPNILQLLRESRKTYKNNDKVHIWEYYYPLSIFPLLISTFNRKRRKKTILTTDGFVGYSYKPKKPWWLVPAFKVYTQLFARFLFKIPKTMTTYGKSMLPYAKKAGVPMKKLKVIPTGIHLDRFKNVNKNKINQLKKEFNIQKNEKVILFVGMLTERKGVDKVIKVSYQLLKEGYNVKTLIVGDSHGPNVFKKLVPKIFNDKIIFTGGRKEIPEFMKLDDVLLLPSEGEGLPGVVMEAMASGLPVVATREGCTPDLIDHFLFNNEKQCYIHIKKIINNNLKIKKESKKIDNYKWKSIYEKYLHLYRN